MPRILLTYIFIVFSVLTAFSAARYEVDIPGVDASGIGVYIEDLVNPEVVLDVNGEIPLIPASITKAITCSSALNVIDPDSRFITTVYADGKISKGILHGNLTINAVGDPTVESRHFSTTRGFADSIATAVSRAGIKTITGKILITYSKTLESGVPSGWMDEDLIWPYGTEFHAMNYADNSTIFNSAKKTTRPFVPNLTVTRNKNSAKLSRLRNSKAINVSGSSKEVATTIANPDPESSARCAVRSALQDIGITVEGRHVKPAGPHKRIYAHKSPSYIDIMVSLMHRSDNLMAEGMLHAIQPDGNIGSIIKKELEMWYEKGVDTCGIVIEDGSGLSRNNRISPYFMADVLIWMVNNGNSDGRYLSLFPRAGIEGSMKNFGKGTPLEGRFAAKTGSMRGVQCYAGFMLSNDGSPTHVVIVMINNFNGSRARLKKSIEELLIQNLL